jgi:hypothetical protein
MQRIALAESDHALGKRAGGFGAKKRGLNTLLLNEIGDEIPQHSAAMSRLLSEFEA